MIVKRKLDERLRWFPEARFGMFVHFGVYALLERGEWVMYHEDTPREEYAKLARRFNPHRFDADEWVETAKRAGARYITVTAKHHDGFCLFDSALTDYKITNTPFGRDLIGELIDACHRKNLRICLYYSQPDWHHPNFVHREGAFKDLQYERPDDEPDWPKFVEYVEGQVLELCTKYGRIDGIWFDGVHKTEREWRGKRLYRLIKQHQPGAIVNDRAGCGDLFTPERSLSYRAAAAGYLVESCQAICREAWGYRRDASLFSSPLLIESLVRMAAGGGNYLLNIGPKPDGSLPADQVQRLEDIGVWLGAHAKSIYGTQGRPLRNESDDVVYTRSGRHVYVHLLRWPDSDELALRQLRRPPLRARLLKTGTRLRIEASGDEATLRGLPSMPPDVAVNVIELTFDREDVWRAPPRPTRAEVHSLGTQDTLTLPAHTATCQGFGPKGSTLQVLSGDTPERRAQSHLGGWSSLEQKAAWQVQCAKRVRCEVAVEMACPRVYAGSTFAVKVGRQAVTGAVPATKGFGQFRWVKLGVIELPAGRSALSLTPTQLNYGYVFAEVRRVRLKPVGAS